MSSLQAQSGLIAQQAQQLVNQKGAETLTFNSGTSGLSVTSSGTLTVKVVAIVLKFANGTVYNLSQTTILPSGASALVQSIIPGGNCGGATCLSKYNSIVSGAAPGSLVGIVTSFGNVFWSGGGASPLTVVSFFGDGSDGAATITATAMALDGSTTGSGSGSAASWERCTSGSFTTTSSPDVIITAVMCRITSSSTGNCRVGGISDTAGLNWYPRLAFSPTSVSDIEEWYAATSGTISADIVTYTITDPGGSATSPSAVAFGISGADTTLIFDPSQNFPYSATCSSSCTTPTLSGMTTTTGSEFMIGLEGHVSSTAETVGSLGGSTATLISSKTNAVAPTESSSAEYKVGTASSSGCSFGTSVAVAWGMLCDAVVGRSSTTLTRNMNYASLTVNSGAILNTNGYTIRVSGTLTNNGIITDYSGPNGVSGGMGGTGVSASTGNPGGSGAPGALGSSGYGTAGAGGGGGGAGGGGSDINTYSGGAGGSGYPSAPGGSGNYCCGGTQPSANAPTASVGSGGGGGGTGADACSGCPTVAGLNGGAGGTGGKGGGRVIIFAYTLEQSGVH